MADRISAFRVNCKAGLVSAFDLFAQAEQVPGGAISLVNYEPAITGGYRRIDGFTNTYGTIPGQEGVLGLHINEKLNAGIFGWRKKTGSETSYFYRWSGTSWTPVPVHASILDTNITKIRAVNIRWGVDKMVWVDGVNCAQSYDGTNVVRLNSATAPVNPRFVTLFANHLFLAGTSADPYNLYFSAPLNEADFTPANGAGVINVGFEIVQIKGFRNNLYIFGKNQIKKLIGDNAANFKLDDVAENLGCLVPDSVIELAGDLMFLSRDGFRPVSGTERIGDVELNMLSPQIRDKVIAFTEDLTTSNINPETVSCVTLTKKTQFRLFAREPVFGFLGAVRQSIDSRMVEFSQLFGIQATCAASGAIGADEIVLHGTSEGLVMEQENGTSFAGESILSIYQTPYFYMEDPTIRKVFRDVVTFLKSSGNTTIALSVKYNFENQTKTYNPSNYAITSEGAAAFYNDFLYDATAVYDGDPSPVVQTKITGSGMSASFRYVTNNIAPSHTIQGIVVLYTPEDRR